MIQEFLREIREKEKQAALDEALALFPQLNISNQTKNEETTKQALITEIDPDSEVAFGTPSQEEATPIHLENPCEICGKSESKYKCPKCSLSYCSLACYKNEEKHD